MDAEKGSRQERVAALESKLRALRVARVANALSNSQPRAPITRQDAKQTLAEEIENALLLFRNLESQRRDQTGETAVNTFEEVIFHKKHSGPLRSFSSAQEQTATAMSVRLTTTGSEELRVKEFLGSTMKSQNLVLGSSAECQKPVQKTRAKGLCRDEGTFESQSNKDSRDDVRHTGEDVEDIDHSGIAFMSDYRSHSRSPRKESALLQDTQDSGAVSPSANPLHFLDGNFEEKGTNLKDLQVQTDLVQKLGEMANLELHVQQLELSKLEIYQKLQSCQLACETLTGQVEFLSLENERLQRSQNNMDEEVSKSQKKVEMLTEDIKHREIEITQWHEQDRETWSEFEGIRVMLEDELNALNEQLFAKDECIRNMTHEIHMRDIEFQRFDKLKTDEIEQLLELLKTRESELKQSGLHQRIIEDKLISINTIQENIDKALSSAFWQAVALKEDLIEQQTIMMWMPLGNSDAGCEDQETSSKEAGASEQRSRAPVQGETQTQSAFSELQNEPWCTSLLEEPEGSNWVKYAELETHDSLEPGVEILQRAETAVSNGENAICSVKASLAVLETSDLISQQVTLAEKEFLNTVPGDREASLKQKELALKEWEYAEMKWEWISSLEWRDRKIQVSALLSGIITSLLFWCLYAPYQNS